MPCRHILSPREERMQRDVRGAKPPEPPGGLVDFLLMKIDSNAATRTGQYNEGARLGAGLKQYSGPNPRGRSPLLYRRFL